MQKINSDRIFSITDSQDFERLSLNIFNHQVEYCEVYGRFVNHLGVDPSRVKNSDQIPFLPIEFFKNHRIVSGKAETTEIFSSSGTTGMTQSKHYVSDISIYKNSYRKAFELFYGDIRNYAILALLPSYLERGGSSLIYMVDDLIAQSGNPLSGYFLYDHQRLEDTLNQLKKSGTPTLLIGVTYALLDFAKSRALEFPELIVMETGGMKGQRKEMLRTELHDILCKGFGVSEIHSEYGMTELLSQAYSKGKGKFNCPPWMKVKIRDTNDPMTLLEEGQTGGVNIIDLANINSCSFIASQDLGKRFKDESFEILGRFDNSDIRGCNLLVQ